MADTKPKKNTQAADLRAEIQAAQDAAGTIVRFTLLTEPNAEKKRNRRPLQHVAQRSEDGYWIVASIDRREWVGPRLTHEQFLRLMAEDRVTNAEVVTAFDTFKP